MGFILQYQQNVRAEIPFVFFTHFAHPGFNQSVQVDVKIAAKARPLLPGTTENSVAASNTPMRPGTCSAATVRVQVFSTASVGRF